MEATLFVGLVAAIAIGVALMAGAGLLIIGELIWKAMNK